MLWSMLLLAIRAFRTTYNFYVVLKAPLRCPPPPAGCSVLLSVGEAERQAARNYRTHSSLTAAFIFKDRELPRGTLGVAVLPARGRCSVTATEEERKVRPSAFLPLIPFSVRILS